MHDNNPIEQYINANAQRFIEDLQRLVQQPGISAHGSGLTECAEVLATMMAASGIEAQVVQTAGQPVVVGEVCSKSNATTTLLIHTHYDVQPPEPLEAWEAPPFAAEVRGNIMIGRGTTDPKGNVVAAIKAVEALLAVDGDVPLNIKFLFDGEEEIGSPSLPGFVKKNLEFLKADAVLSFDAGFDATGRPFVWLGSSGILFVEMRATGSNKDLHSSRASLVPNPAWDLVWALESIRGLDGRVRINGFYDDVHPPSQEDRQLLEVFPWNQDSMCEDLGVTKLSGDVSGTKALERLLFEPTCTICGFTTGYDGPGPKSVLPNVATAKLEFRLISEQTPEDVFQRLVQHLEGNGFDNIECLYLGGCEPSKSPPTSDICRTVVRVAEEIYGVAPVIKPKNEASGRMAPWTANQFHTAGVITGIGPPDWHGHAPNEFITLEHYLKGILFAASIYRAYSCE